jgi:transposase
MTEDRRLDKWTRLYGSDRTDFRDLCVELYERDALSVRQISKRTGRSYGAVHKMLREAGVQMRPRGNPWLQ